MKEISIFDVIGPNMIGPSSSHTAGALRIALMVHKLAGEPIKKVDFYLYGSFAKTYKGHGTDKALVAGILGMDTEDERIREAFVYAAERMLTYTFHTIESHAEVHPNTVEIIAETTTGEQTRVMAASIGGGNIRIDAINGVAVEFSGEYTTLIVKQADAPGSMACMTKVLAERGINIAFMRVYREEKGSFGYSIIEIDGPIEESIIDEIRQNPSIINIKMLKGI